jgi:hypothetical protein
MNKMNQKRLWGDATQWALKGFLVEGWTSPPIVLMFISFLDTGISLSSLG